VVVDVTQTRKGSLAREVSGCAAITTVITGLFAAAVTCGFGGVGASLPAAAWGVFAAVLGGWVAASRRYGRIRREEWARAVAEHEARVREAETGDGIAPRSDHG
jgi:hypothetical protein